MIDRWHPDAMEGLDIVQKNKIKTYSFELPSQIAKEKGLPVPQFGFDKKQKFMLDRRKLFAIS